MPDIRCIAVVGTGAMGTGIAQIAAQAGLTVWLFDSRAEAAAEARQRLRQTFESLCGKGKLSAADAEAAQNRLRVAERLEQLGDCELVVEAIVERLEAKQELLRRLEAIVAPETILASNTSSLSITAIAAACERPQRVAGFHFFNPVPLMRVVEVVDGLASAPEVGDALLALAARLGHRGVRTKDSPASSSTMPAAPMAPRPCASSAKASPNAPRSTVCCASVPASAWGRSNCSILPASTCRTR
ncbi:3-hydroxy-acyl-CoA dehydrogenase [Pseudomonas aeruginosa]|nr:3-hydroxy-acyl-CoA dehydrogenase [Pseudomonas aeruginosa]